MKTPLLLFLLVVPSSWCASFLISTGAPAANSNFVGSGTWTETTPNPNPLTGTWTLNSTAATVTDGWVNGGLLGGANGVEYTFNHDWNRVDGTTGAQHPLPVTQTSNMVTFSWTGNAGQHIRISQSNYNAGTGFNGGSGNTGASFTLNQPGYLSDPNNQVFDSSVAGDSNPTGAYPAGAVFREPWVPNQTRNNVDNWYIDLPAGVTSVTVDYSWYDGGGNVNELVNEWLSFNLVPEPSRAVLLSLGLVGFLLRRTRS